MNWMKKNPAAAFIIGLVLVGVVLFLAGAALTGSTNEYVRGVGIILIQLSGTTIAATVATIFFSFEDVRKNLSTSLATLFSEGDVIPLLSEETQDTLVQTVVEQRAALSPLHIDRELHDYLWDTMPRYHQMPHIRNFHYVVTLSPLENNELYLTNETVITGLMTASHLSQSQRTLEYKYRKQIVIHSEEDLKSLKFKFNAEIGDNTFDDTAIKTTIEKSGNTLVYSMIFKSILELPDELLIKLRINSYSLASDHVEIWRARYPTFGFHGSVYFSNAFSYDGAWFGNADTELGVTPGQRTAFASVSNGISVVTNNWILPGDGFVIDRTPLEETKS